MSDSFDLDAQIVEKSLNDSAFRAELLASPKQAVAKHFEMNLPEDFSLNVIEDTDNSLTIVLPPSSESLSVEQLAEVAGGYIAGCKGCTRGSLGKKIKHIFGATESPDITTNS